MQEQVIDLNGPAGNAFFLLSRAGDLAVQLGLDSDAITDEMIEGDYENLISVFTKYFGDYVTLER